MSLPTPIWSQEKFIIDASIGGKIDFIATNGDEYYGFKITIKNNESGALVHEETYTGLRVHVATISADLLTNGTFYKATVKVKDNEDNWGEESDFAIIKCYSTPHVEITNIPTTGVIHNSSYNFSATYTQAESVKINRYYYILYDNKNNIIKTSSNSSVLTNSFGFTIGSLANNQTYRIKVVATNSEGVISESGLYTFAIAYSSEGIYKSIKLDNLPLEAAIDVSGTIKRLMFDIYREPPIYIDGESIDLINDKGNFIYLDGVVTFTEPFTVDMWLKEVVEDEHFLMIKNKSNGDYIKLVYQSDDNMIHCYKKVGVSMSHYRSEALGTVHNTEEIYVHFVLKDGRVELKASIITIV